jgi:hypothetical protein
MLLPVKVDADNQVTDTWQIPSSLCPKAASQPAAAECAAANAENSIGGKGAGGGAGTSEVRQVQHDVVQEVQHEVQHEGASAEEAGGGGAGGGGAGGGREGEDAAGDAARRNYGRALLHAVIRSKGFVWLANAPKDINYWSHAGHFFSLEALHEWWIASPINVFWNYLSAVN